MRAHRPALVVALLTLAATGAGAATHASADPTRPAASTVAPTATPSPAATRTPAAHRPTGHAPTGRLAAGVRDVALCPDVPGEARCGVHQLEDRHGEAVAPGGQDLADGPTLRDDGFFDGYTPAQVQEAYGVTGLRSGGRTVAIVAGYGYARAAADLAVYRERYGLPACTVESGCLTIVDQRGGTALPPENPRWANEQALDLDAVSATCPDCRILLVQADNAQMANLAQAVDTAAAHPGVVAISNSWVVSGVDDTMFGSHFDHPGIAITAATGDWGHEDQPGYPASSSHVVAVGGTWLIPDASTTRGYAEYAWDEAGSGCVPGQRAPKGQDPAVTTCQGRAMADVSALANPGTGLAVYGGATPGWSVRAGTSLSTPVVAAMYALAGPSATPANEAPYAHPGEFNDILYGSTGDCGVICTSGPGWDGPTGVGSPRGIAGLRGGDAPTPTPSPTPTETTTPEPSLTPEPTLPTAAPTTPTPDPTPTGTPTPTSTEVPDPTTSAPTGDPTTPAPPTSTTSAPGTPALG